MSQSGAYLVFDAGRNSTARWLKISGPFCYGTFEAYGTSATPLSFARAHDFARAYGTEQAVVVGVDRVGDEHALMAAAQEAASVKVLATSGWGWST